MAVQTLQRIAAWVEPRWQFVCPVLLMWLHFGAKLALKGPLSARAFWQQLSGFSTELVACAFGIFLGLGFLRPTSAFRKAFVPAAGAVSDTQAIAIVMSIVAYIVLWILAYIFARSVATQMRRRIGNRSLGKCVVSMCLASLIAFCALLLSMHLIA